MTKEEKRQHELSFVEKIERATIDTMFSKNNTTLSPDDMSEGGKDYQLTNEQINVFINILNDFDRIRESNDFETNITKKII